MSHEDKSSKTETGAQEPSMEDILTSIRRILSEENEGESESRTRAGADPAGEGDPPPASGGGEPAEDEPATGETRIGADAPALEVPPAPARKAARVLELTPAMRVGRVVSAPTQAASEDVLAELAKAILNRRDIAVGGRDVTLEGMVREMLRPLLQEWLDRNLPYLIERLVKKEIDSMINRAERLED